MLLERGFLRPRARRSRRRSAHRSRSSPIPPVTCVGRDSMSPPSSPTRTPSTAGGLRRGEGLRLLRWPTAPSSSMGSIRFRSGGAAREAAAGTLGSIRSFPSVAPKARIWRTFLAQFYDVLAPAEGLRPTSRSSCTVFGFCYLLVWGYIADLSMVPRLRRGRLAGRALSHPFILRGQKRSSRCLLYLASVALFKLGAHSATLRPEFGERFLAIPNICRRA